MSAQVADERMLADGTLLPNVIRTAPDAQLEVSASDPAQRVHRGPLRRGLPLRAIDPAGGVFPGPRTGPAGGGAGCFRIGRPGQPRSWPRTGAAALSHGKIIVLRRRAGRRRIGPA